MHDLGLVQPIDRFGQRVVVAVSDASDKRLDAGFGQALGVANRHILRSAVAVMHQRVAGTPRVKRLFERIEHELGLLARRQLPADDSPCVDVDDEGDVGKSLPSRNKGVVADPQLVRTVRFERAMHQVWTDQPFVDISGP